MVVYRDKSRKIVSLSKYRPDCIRMYSYNLKCCSFLFTHQIFTQGNVMWCYQPSKLKPMLHLVTEYHGKFSGSPTANANLNLQTKNWFKASYLHCQIKIICYCVSALDYGQYILLSIEKVRRRFSQHKWPRRRLGIIHSMDGRQHSCITVEVFRINTLYFTWCFLTTALCL